MLLFDEIMAFEKKNTKTQPCKKKVTSTLLCLVTWRK